MARVSARLRTTWVLTATSGGTSMTTSPRICAAQLNRRLAARALSTADAGRAADALRDLDRVLAVMEEPDAGLDAELARLLDRRQAARAARDWTAADRLRDELAAHGVVVEDTRDGQRWRRTPVA